MKSFKWNDWILPATIKKQCFYCLFLVFKEHWTFVYIYQFYLSLTLFQIVMRNRRVYLNIQVYVIRSIVSVGGGISRNIPCTYTVISIQQYWNLNFHPNHLAFNSFYFCHTLFSTNPVNVYVIFITLLTIYVNEYANY